MLNRFDVDTTPNFPEIHLVVPTIKRVLKYIGSCNWLFVKIKEIDEVYI